MTKISKLWKKRAEQAICTKRCPLAIIESILGLWQKRLDTFCENRKKACKDLGQIGAAKNYYHHHHHVFTLDRGTSPWIDPTGVCSAWLVLTIRVRSVWWDRLSILFLDDHVFWSKLRIAFLKRLRADITFMHNGLPQFKWYKLGKCRLTLSVTSSTPIINPLPLTSPTTFGNSLLRSRSFSIKYVPTTSEFFCVPSSSMACQQKYSKREWWLIFLEWKATKDWQFSAQTSQGAKSGTLYWEIVVSKLPFQLSFSFLLLFF